MCKSLNVDYPDVQMCKSWLAFVQMCKSWQARCANGMSTSAPYRWRWVRKQGIGGAEWRWNKMPREKKGNLVWQPCIWCELTCIWCKGSLAHLVQQRSCTAHNMVHACTCSKLHIVEHKERKYSLWEKSDLVYMVWKEEDMIQFSQLNRDKRRRKGNRVSHPRTFCTSGVD